jgi:hypothetical protein
MQDVELFNTYVELIKNTLNDVIHQKLISEARLSVMEKTLKDRDAQILQLEAQLKKSTKRTKGEVSNDYSSNI